MKIVHFETHFRAIQDSIRNWNSADDTKHAWSLCSGVILERDFSVQGLNEVKRCGCLDKDLPVESGRLISWPTNGEQGKVHSPRQDKRHPLPHTTRGFHSFGVT